MKIKVGIFFGGRSREREISFAGGRTVYDNLNKDIFEPIPIFIDSIGNFILLDWQYLYKGTIRDFYPPIDFLPTSPNGFQIYIECLGNLSNSEINEIINKVGKKIEPTEFNSLFDFAFLALHGPYGEDGNIQGLLEWYGMPFSGAGILPSAIGIDKAIQQNIFSNAGFVRPERKIINREEWKNNVYKGNLLEKLVANLGLPFVIKPPRQGSSIGITVLNEKDNNVFRDAVNKAFFIEEISAAKWNKFSEGEKVYFIHNLIDIRQGIGLPVWVENEIIYHPEALLFLINNRLKTQESIILETIDGEEEVLFESFIDGKEFSCIVVEDENNQALALPPTEVVKYQSLFDYRSKYLPGMSRKITPINIATDQIEAIRTLCKQLFKEMFCDVYARIDGFITQSNEIFLNDPNTTSGMLPSSFFFHQAAEIGLNPSQFLTYIIRTSIAARIRTGKNNNLLKIFLKKLDDKIIHYHTQFLNKIKIAVVMGGFSSERHISVESGRNIYEKLSSSSQYQPIPVFLTGAEENHELYVIPVNVMLKDNADDIKEKIKSSENNHPILDKIKTEAAHLTYFYTGNNIILKPKRITYTELAEIVDEVFIALHGRPGEDGAIQKELEKVGLAYNGSGIESSRITINKFETNEILKNNNILIANHALVFDKEWNSDNDELIDKIENEFKYPFIAKPADDGCSSAVKKIKNREEFIAFSEMMFRKKEEFIYEAAEILNLKQNEEFPQKNYFLIEDLIDKKNAIHFLEITGGLLTKINENGEREYEIFEPSEALASGEVLSLEEKFLAGEGQNITPARFSKDKNLQHIISEKVRETFEKTAKILNIEGYARIDAFVRIFEDNSVETIIIEVNSLPGMTPATCIFHQAAISGYKPYNFIDSILKYGLLKKEINAL